MTKTINLSARRSLIVTTAQDSLTDSARGHRFAGRVTGPCVSVAWLGRLSVVSVRRR